MGSSIKNISAGFTLVEALIAIALMLLVTVGGMAASSLTTGTLAINEARSKANFLARQGMEAVESARAANFTILRSGEYHPQLGANGWELASGPETIDNFTRSITLTPVMRSLSCTTSVCEIVSGGGVVDNGSFKAKVTVSWKEGTENKSYSLDSLITYWR